MAVTNHKISRKQAAAQSVKHTGDITLFAKRMQIYPKAIKGLMRRIKWIALGVLLTAYYLLPLLRWHREEGRPDQAILLDMAHERFYFFGIELWPQELYIMAGLILLFVVGLFLVSSLFGRVWCGYSCPQTLWTDLFMLVERRIEGDRNERIRRDEHKLTFDKAWRKTAKHVAWLAIAFVTGGVWITYYMDARTFYSGFLTGDLPAPAYLFTGIFTATTYLLAGWAREQVCTYMCPWPRFQAAMSDDQTYIVTYEAWRGEPRAKGKKDVKVEGAGDCIDCGQCVAVCPTGIDIRDGNQLECIGCGLCIDACNDVMEKVGRPKFLVTFDTLARQDLRQKGISVPVKLVRARTLLYLSIMLIGATLVATALVTRPLISLEAMRDRAPFYVMLDQGTIMNGYTLKIVNKTAKQGVFDLSLGQFEGARFKVVEFGEAAMTSTELQVHPDQVGEFHVQVLSPPHSMIAAQPVDFVLRDPSSGEQSVFHSVFMGPLSVDPQ